MKKKLPEFHSDADIEDFMQKDMSDYLHKGNLKATTFDFLEKPKALLKDANINMRLSSALLENIKKIAEQKNITYQLYIREVFEKYIANYIQKEDYTPVQFDFMPKFEFLPKDVKMNMRLPISMLNNIKNMKTQDKLTYQRHIRMILEQSLKIMQNEKLRNNVIYEQVKDLPKQEDSSPLAQNDKHF